MNTSSRPFHLSAVALAVVALGAIGSATAQTAPAGTSFIRDGERLPTGKRITPTAAPGADFRSLNPGLSSNPDYLVDHAVDSIISPDGTTLLILTSGYNRSVGPDGENIPGESTEHVFVYDIGGDSPELLQTLQVPNTFNGIAWNPVHREFYVSGGVDDNLLVFEALPGGPWIEADSIPLGHDEGAGRFVGPVAAGIAVSASGERLLVTNFENDSVSLIDLGTRAVVGELDLRPGKLDPSLAGRPGGTFPFAAAFRGDDKVYVSAQRDREVVVIDIADDDGMFVVGRIPSRGQPNKMVLDAARSRLYVASDNSDTVLAIDTDTDALVEEIPVTAPGFVFPDADGYKGANPNNVALSPDGGTLFVTNGGTNSVAVVQLAHAVEQGEEENDAGEDGEAQDDLAGSRVIGLIPTGWYPNGVAIKPDGSTMYVVNGKGVAGPNPLSCRDTTSIAEDALDACRSADQYVWQLEKAGFLSQPVPDARELANLTWQVAYNNEFLAAADHSRWERTMDIVRDKIEHVVYVVKENRTYDQIHGDLEIGDGDPSLAILSPYAPNHNALARRFVVLDNFLDSGETSGVGWNWSTAARTTDFVEKTQPVNYAGRGLSYDWEGANRNVNVALDGVEERRTVDPEYPDDPDLLAGTADVAAPDDVEGEAGTGYLWDEALRAGLTVRNYGFFVSNLGDSSTLDEEVLARPFANGVEQVVAANEALAPHTDTYFRGYDQNNADFYLYKEWEREFDDYVASGELPNLSLVRFPHDHFGNFGTAKFGVDTVETQMADNDYAVGLLVEKVANSAFADNTLVFVVEDDAQNGGDHVDAHRSIAYVAGPYVKQNALVTQRYTTVSMLRTIEEVLGLQPLGINDGLTAPMVEVFDPRQGDWSYAAEVPEILYTTSLELPDPATTTVAKAPAPCLAQPERSAEYWQAMMAGNDFTVEDNLDTDRFNAALWEGLAGGAAQPTERHGRDLREGRAALLEKHRRALAEGCR